MKWNERNAVKRSTVHSFHFFPLFCLYLAFVGWKEWKIERIRASFTSFFVSFHYNSLYISFSSTTFLWELEWKEKERRQVSERSERMRASFPFSSLHFINSIYLCSVLLISFTEFFCSLYIFSINHPVHFHYLVGLLFISCGFTFSFIGTFCNL